MALEADEEHPLALVVAHAIVKRYHQAFSRIGVERDGISWLQHPPRGCVPALVRKKERKPKFYDIILAWLDPDGVGLCACRQGALEIHR